MRRHYDGDKLLADVHAAIEGALSAHGLSLYSLLGVTTVLECIASPLKYQIGDSRFGRRTGVLGVDTYVASRLARAVALLQSPNSLVVNPMMECIAMALSGSKRALPTRELERDALRVFLDHPRLTLAGVPKAHRENASLAPAFQSALSYLEEGEIAVPNEDRTSWRIGAQWEFP